MKQFTIDHKQAGQRFDKYLFKVLNDAPKSFVYKMLRKKNIVLNGKKATGQEILNASDEVKIFLADDTFEKFSSMKKMEPQKIQKLEALPSVIFEDEDILVINKPAGVLSQKAKPSDYSANEWIIQYLLDKGELSEADLIGFRPSICNRLDRNTSGLLIAGKTIQGLQQMGELLQSRDLKKYYHCLVKGKITGDAYLKGYLCKDHVTNKVSVSKDRHSADDQYIETSYHPLKVLGGMTLLEVHLITGRSHQIRAHLASVGHPILGDDKYGIRNINQKLKQKFNLKGQLLHAHHMIFPDGRIIAAEDPEVFGQIMKEGL